MFTKLLGRIAAILLAMMMVTSVVSASTPSIPWPSGGQNLSNTRFQIDTSLKASNVANLSPKWQFTTAGDVSATPSVDANNVYFPDWGGYLNAVSRINGTLVWRIKVADITGYYANPSYGIFTDDIARDTPAIDANGNQLIFGDQAGYHGGQMGYVMAVDINTGALHWKTQVGNVFTIVTQSPVVYGNTVYVGTASAEEGFAGIIPGYVCCSARGVMYALDTKTGAIKWRTYMLPATAGYSGASVWGSTPVVDTKRNSLYITTGNNYSLPASVQNCIIAANGDPGLSQQCVADDHFDSIVSLDLNTGAIKWAKWARTSDAWNVSCYPDLLPGGIITNPGNCPPNAGPDYDFGQGAMLYTVNGQDYLAAGQKSGQFWALNPDTGAVLWQKQVVPGGIGGGFEWGSSTDGQNIYFGSANTDHTATMVNGTSITSGWWGALNAATGAVVWQKADPAGGNTTDSAAVSSIPGVVFVCSQDPVGHMYALDSSNGNILWSFASGGSCNAGAAIANGAVYWGSGYSNFGNGTGNNKFYAFSTK